MTMKLPILTLVLGAVAMINGENRKLTYIYTALSRPNSMGIPEFTAMGLLDHRQLDYFDSTNDMKIPRKPWMRNLGEEYFSKGTQSRRNKMQWFKFNLEILKKRISSNDTGLHVLQWQHGCEVDQQPDGKVNFIRGIDRYSYDGDDFLDYDSKYETWVSTMDAAKVTQNKWNGVQDLIKYTEAYLKNECIDWLIKFSDFEREEVRKEKPELHIFSKKSVSATKHVLTCLATGLPSTRFSVTMKRNGRDLAEADGLRTVGLNPNHDETFQQRYYVELLRTDEASYSCHVSQLNFEKIWDGKLPPEDSNVAVKAGVACFIVTVIIGLAVLAYLLKKKKICCPPELEPITAFFVRGKHPGWIAVLVKLPSEDDQTTKYPSEELWGELEPISAFIGRETGKRPGLISVLVKLPSEDTEVLVELPSEDDQTIKFPPKGLLEPISAFTGREAGIHPGWISVLVKLPSEDNPTPEIPPKGGSSALFVWSDDSGTCQEVLVELPSEDDQTTKFPPKGLRGELEPISAFTGREAGKRPGWISVLVKLPSEDNPTPEIPPKGGSSASSSRSDDSKGSKQSTGSSADGSTGGSSASSSRSDDSKGSKQSTGSSADGSTGPWVADLSRSIR